MKTVLTIAGFDPSSGAGVTADLKVFAAHGLFGTSCITSLTVQSTRGVRSSHPVDAEILLASLQYLAEDLPPAGIKIGMLATAANVQVVVQVLSQLRSRYPKMPVVLDPVLHSTSGRELLDPDGIDLLRSHLLPLVDWITPNLDELAILTVRPAAHRDDLLSAASALRQLARPQSGGPISILVTGGHLIPPDDLLLVEDAEPVWLPGRQILSTSTHGTGCAFSSALLSRIVLGDTPYAAAYSAKEYVAQAIRSASPIGSGKGPLNHLWPLSQPLNPEK